MLYFGSLVIGVFAGFSISKLVLMILFKIVDVRRSQIEFFRRSACANRHCILRHLPSRNGDELCVYQKQSILSLFKVTSATEDKVKRISVFQMIIGLLGILFILSGYYVSTELFSGKFKTVDELFYAMSFILGTVIIGTYLFYKGSVSFVSNIIRKSKGGYLNIYEVLSLSSIMFRMKSNALLLTIITTVSALAIGLLSLSYISYYSAEKTAEQNVAADFAMTNQKDAKRFEQLLDENNISYSKKKFMSFKRFSIWNKLSMEILKIWLETRGNCPSPWSAMQRLPGWTCQKETSFFRIYRPSPEIYGFKRDRCR